MAWMPGAVRSPYPTPGRAKRRKGRGVAYHVAVSEAESLRPWPGADWHFYVSKKGTIYQFIDTDLQSWTTGAGNSSMIGVETQGGVRDAENEPWTDAQLDALARIARWAHETEGIPLRLMKSSHPTERGLGWHKLGVRPWVVPGGEIWSSAYAKSCPGLRKISQMPEVLRRAQNGATATQESQSVQQEDDDMPAVISQYVPPNTRAIINIPPAESGAVGWGAAYASFVVDSFGDPTFPKEGVPVRIYVMQADGDWRRWHPDYKVVPLKGNWRYSARLAKGDTALVVTAEHETFGVGVCVELTKA